MKILHFLEMAVWLAVASVGFAKLFNVPKKALITAAVLAAIGGTCKLILIHFGVHITLASLIGAIVVGFLSIPAAHKQHVPPLILSIPAVIPMIPGAFAYEAMLGFFKLTYELDAETYQVVLNHTINNGLKAIFIIFSLTAGVSFPMLISRKESAKNIHF
ncbi:MULTISPECIES: threonine/serine exporter family protein [unclassified Polaribacter]|uniref:threonine/serine exporter family protein n=1 Tax=unclassified Polaribacter TaxID=196858 RepID=UPI001407F748|nr:MULTISPECIES: threonine/serine exporter family protein [unclassified Polaribacter]